MDQQIMAVVEQDNYLEENLIFHQLQQDHQFRSVLQTVEVAITKAETQHLEPMDSLFTWLHTVEVQHKETDSLEIVDQEQITLQEEAQAAADKETGLTHGAQAEAAVALMALENMVMFGQTVEDTQDTLVVLDTLQKDHLEEVQVGLILMTQEDTLLADVVEQGYTGLQAEAAAQEEVLEAEVLTEADKGTETMSEHLEQMHKQTLAQVAVAAAETTADQVSA